MLTREQLDHLCTLTALHLSDAEKDKLLPQLEHILTFVHQLEDCQVDSDLVEQHTAHTSLEGTPHDQTFSDQFFHNIRHEKHDNMPVLGSGLTKET